ncbi:uncharacterized protein ACIBXB_021794 isoform 2-T3 [Morphnus guianensis]
MQVGLRVHRCHWTGVLHTGRALERQSQPCTWPSEGRAKVKPLSDGLFDLHLLGQRLSFAAAIFIADAFLHFTRQEITEQRMRAADASLARGSLRRR